MRMTILIFFSALVAVIIHPEKAFATGPGLGIFEALLDLFVYVVAIIVTITFQLKKKYKNKKFFIFHMVFCTLYVFHMFTAYGIPDSKSLILFLAMIFILALPPMFQYLDMKGK